VEAHEYYEKETGKLYYKEAALELELTDDYINWLERNVVKLFAIPNVVGQSEQLCDCKKHSIKTTYAFKVCTKCGNEWND
jgi:hypothetical protein